MVNYRVEDLHVLVKALREEGCNVLDKIAGSEYGKFAWVIDPASDQALSLTRGAPWRSPSFLTRAATHS
jgi:hypothetical protein